MKHFIAFITLLIIPCAFLSAQNTRTKDGVSINIKNNIEEINPSKDINKGCNKTMKLLIIHEFKTAQRDGDKNRMNFSVSKMIKHKIIYKGMKLSKFYNILSKGNHSTGIYIPGGFSIGYGNQKGNVRNYHLFYWFHFKTRDWDKENTNSKEEARLINWGDL